MECPDTPWAGTPDHRIKRKQLPGPSKAALFFLDFLKGKGITRGRLIDIGCGDGRNAVHFAQNGFEVHAVDHSEDILKDLDLHDVMPHCHSVTDYWLFEDGFFDLAIDVLCYSEQENPGLYLSELRRVLKPGGFFLLSIPKKDLDKHEIEKAFLGFKVVASENGKDTVSGKSIETINIVLLLS